MILFVFFFFSMEKYNASYFRVSHIHSIVSFTDVYTEIHMCSENRCGKMVFGRTAKIIKRWGMEKGQPDKRIFITENIADGMRLGDCVKEIWRKKRNSEKIFKW